MGSGVVLQRCLLDVMWRTQTIENRELSCLTGTHPPLQSWREKNEKDEELRAGTSLKVNGGVVSLTLMPGESVEQTRSVASPPSDPTLFLLYPFPASHQWWLL